MLLMTLPMLPHWLLPSRSDPQGPVPGALSSHRQQETFMITIPGQLAIKTIHGRNGDFNVGRLATSIGEFVVKNAELDQYAEGKYEGDFVIAEIRPSTYSANGRMVIEIRALLGGMTLSNIDALSRDEARRLSPQEVDPIDEEAQAPAPAAPKAPAKAKQSNPRDPLVDTTPFGSEPAAASSEATAEADDAALFGALWPLGEIVKLDATVDRRVCVSSATVSVRWATSSLRCPRTGISPRPDSNRRASGVLPPAGVPPRWGGAPVSYPRRSSCNSHPASLIVPRCCGRIIRCRMTRFAPSRPPSSRTPRTKVAPSGTATSPRRLC
jgi:hypothetical protein